MMKYYIDEVGNFLGGWEADPPQGAIEVEYPPEWYDQVWRFPGWSPSVMRAVAAETTWRDEQMPLAQQNVTAIEYGEDGIVGTAQDWRSYWLALRKWTDANPDFPDPVKRPVAPNA